MQLLPLRTHHSYKHMVKNSCHYAAVWKNTRASMSLDVRVFYYQVGRRETIIKGGDTFKWLLRALLSKWDTVPRITPTVLFSVLFFM